MDTLVVAAQQFEFEVMHKDEGAKDFIMEDIQLWCLCSQEQLNITKMKMCSKVHASSPMQEQLAAMIMLTPSLHCTPKFSKPSRSFVPL